MVAKKTKEKNNEPLEAKLWKAADTLRKNIDAAEYKHVALGLIFLKYISDAFEKFYNELRKDPYADLEDKDEHLARNIFYIPKKRQDGKRLRNMQEVQK